MMIIGCDFHPGFQQIAYVEQETGEYEERRLNHRGEAEAFYRSLAVRAVRVGIEAMGNDRWFHKLMSELVMNFWWGTPARFMLRLRASSGRTSGMPGTF